jgi:hypothetical protein
MKKRDRRIGVVDLDAEITRTGRVYRRLPLGRPAMSQALWNHSAEHPRGQTADSGFVQMWQSHATVVKSNLPGNETLSLHGDAKTRLRKFVSVSRTSTGELQRSEGARSPQGAGAKGAERALAPGLLTGCQDVEQTAPNFGRADL